MGSKAISGQGTKVSIQVTDNKGVTSFVPIDEVSSFSGMDGKASKLDVTHLGSPAKEFRKGLRDNGSFQIEVNRVFDDPGQLALDAAQKSDQPTTFKVVLPNKKTLTFDALVLSFDFKGGVDTIVKSTASLRITGEVTLS